MIVISHDRDLLDDAVDWILHLEGGKLTLYRGGYTAFARAREEKLILDAKHAKKLEAERKHLQAFVDRFKAKASKARQAQSRVKRLAKLGPIVAVTTDEVRPIHFPEPAKELSPPIIALEKVSVGYEPGKPVLRRLSLRIDTDDRIALLGPNGNGKSTLAKLLAGRLKPFDGTVTRPDRIEVAYFAQHQLDELVPQNSVYDHVRRLMPDAPGGEGPRARRRHRLLGRARRHQGRKPVGRREGAAAARACDLRGPAPDHPGRADQPSRHRQPRRAGRGDQRLIRRHDPDLARPASARSLRGPALARRRRHGQRLTRATSTTTAASCSGAMRAPRRAATTAKSSRAPISAAPPREMREELKPLEAPDRCGREGREQADRRHRHDRCAARERPVRARSRQGDVFVEGARRGGRARSPRPRRTGSAPAPSTRTRWRNSAVRSGGHTAIGVPPR